MSTTATESTPIESAAQELAEGIKATAEWKNFHRVNEDFENDEEITRLLGEYRQLVAHVQGARAQGEETPNELRQLEQLQIRIQQNPVFQEREQAASAMLSVFSQANAALSVNLGMEFAANVRSQNEDSGCCGGGGDQGGSCGCS